MEDTVVLTSKDSGMAVCCNGTAQPNPSTRDSQYIEIEYTKEILDECCYLID